MNFKSVCFRLVVSQILLFSMIHAAWAGQGGESHGGDVVVCFDRPYFLGEKKIDPNAEIVGRPELKDFWEYSQLLDFKLMDEPGVSYQVYIMLVLEELKKRDPLTATKLGTMYADFNNYFRFVEDSVLAEVDDSDSTVKPDPKKFCYEIQAAIFKKGRVPGSNYSLINKNLFDLMPEKDKAGLILHELFWFNITQNVADVENFSRYVRHYTFLIFTENVFLAEFGDYFYLKNILQSGIHFFLTKNNAPRIYKIDNQQTRLIVPASYSYKNAAYLEQVTMEFTGNSKFYLPNEIFEPGSFKPVQVRSADKYRACVSLVHDDLKNYGSCR